MEYRLVYGSKNTAIRIVPDGDFAMIEVFHDSKDNHTIVQTINWTSKELRDLAVGALKIARYIDPPEADKKRLEDEAKADVEALLKTL